MTRQLALIALLATSASAIADRVWVGLIPIETGFTSTLTPEPTDIWAYVVTENGNIDPIFSMDLAIPSLSFDGEFVNVADAPSVRNTSGSVLVAGVLPAADTYFSVPEGIDLGNIAIAPGTAIDTSSALSAAYTVTGDIPILAAGQTGVTIATIAVPTGVAPPLPFDFGTAAVRTLAGPVLVPVGAVPEPATAVLGAIAIVPVALRRGRG